jgi:hypothetical protein
MLKIIKNSSQPQIYQASCSLEVFPLQWEYANVCQSFRTSKILLSVRDSFVLIFWGRV